LRLGSPGELGRAIDRNDSALDGISDLLSQAMEELHGVVFALRPPDLDDIGVDAAIERYITQVQRSGLNVHLEMDGELPLLTPEVRLAIYRIVQEALHNALRHAAADEAIVRFETNDDTLRVTIHDNGAGFNPDLASRPTSLGLLSMRERAAAIGATFAVMSRPGDGTTVTVERHIEPESPTAPQLAPVEGLSELSPGAPKRISA
jgi:signal transduction histidine kinase